MSCAIGVRVNVAGDEPVSIYRFLKVPEDWRREGQESTTLNTALSGLLIVLIAAVVIHGLWLLVRWRAERGPSLGTADSKSPRLVRLSYYSHFLNGLSVVERAYDTRLTLPIFTITQILSFVLGSLGVGLMILAALGLATSLYPDWPARLRAARRVPEFRDAVVGGRADPRRQRGVAALARLRREPIHRLRPESRLWATLWIGPVFALLEFPVRRRNERHLPPNSRWLGALL